MDLKVGNHFSPNEPQRDKANNNRPWQLARFRQGCSRVALPLFKYQIQNDYEDKTVARIKDVSIMLIDDAEKLVPIKPICQALEVNYSSQLEKIKSDEILGSTVPLRGIVAADGKEREMACIPFKLVFGWLFTINPKNVKAEAKEQIIKYRLECYNAPFQLFQPTRESF